MRAVFGSQYVGVRRELGHESDEYLSQPSTAIESISSSSDEEVATIGRSKRLKPGLFDHIRARRLWCGLKCFGCIPDPLRHFQKLGVDATRHYGPCGRRSLCVACTLVALCLMYAALAHGTGLYHILGLSPVITLLPWIIVFSLVGFYLIVLVCASSAGIRIAMAAVCRTDRDPHRPSRVRAAYEKIGDFDKDLSGLDPNSQFALQQLTKTRIEVVKEALERGFNVDFAERVRGDDESQRFMLGACILTDADPQALNRELRVYTDRLGIVHVLDASSASSITDYETHTIDQMLRYSGYKEEIALSLALLPPASAAAVLLRWATGHTYEAKVGLNSAWIRQGIGKALNAVNEVDLVRLLLIWPCAQRAEIVGAYDAMSGGPGSLRRHVLELSMSEEYRVAILGLIDSTAETKDDICDSLTNAVRQGNRMSIIKALCQANDSALTRLSLETKDAIRKLFGASDLQHTVDAKTETSQSTGIQSAGQVPLPLDTTLAAAIHSRTISTLEDQAVSTPVLLGAGTPSGREESSLVVEPGPGGILPYWLRERWGDVRQSVLQKTVCGAPVADQFETVINVQDAVKRSTSRFVSRAINVVGKSFEDLQDLVTGPSSDSLVRMLLQVCRSNGLAGRHNLSEYYKAELCNCAHRQDLMGLLSLLLPLSGAQREQLLDITCSVDSTTDENSLPAMICKHNYRLMELVVLGHFMPKEYVWARTIYEACYGGVSGLGLGTDEETLTAALVLNWHQRHKLRDALLRICKWKGNETSIENMIDNEIENVNFKVLLLNLVHT